MAYVDIPKDLTQVKNKIAFGLTKRQLICFPIAALVGIPFFLFTKSILGNEISMTIAMILMSPFFLLGIYEKDGQPLERVVQYRLRATVFYPAIRVYKHVNLYEYLTNEEAFKNGDNGETAAKK